MKTFSRLSLLTLVCLSVALLLIGGTPYAQAQSLEVLGGGDHTLGSTVTVTFVTSEQADLKLTGTGVEGVEVTVGDSPGPIAALSKTAATTAKTDADGILAISATITSSVEAYIEATWDRPGNADDFTARADLIGEPVIIPTVIVVKKPDSSPVMISTPGSPSSFTQTIAIQGVDVEEDTDLAAWQMSVVYNPAVLKVTAVEAGTFLPGSAFTHTPSDLSTAAGEVTVSQSVLSNSPGVVGDGTLLTLTFEVLEISDEVLGVHNVLLLNSADERLTYTVSVEGPVLVDDSFDVEDVNRDRMVNVQDLVLVAGSIGTANSTRVDVNGDGFVNIRDLVMVAAKVSAPAAAAGAPLASGITHINPQAVQAWIDLARIEDDGSAIFDLGIANLQALLASSIPTETRLLINYPNPFNPETWIPYQLAEATEVTVTIHAMNGSLIRTLELGHQAAGTYRHKSEAAYWDGRNEFGEQVASGLYFYTLTAGDFSATHKMLVRK